jgi:hypothetical protein
LLVFEDPKGLGVLIEVRLLALPLRALALAQVRAELLLVEELAGVPPLAERGCPGVAAAVVAVDDRYRGGLVERRVEDPARFGPVDPADERRSCSTRSWKGASTSWAYRSSARSATSLPPFPYGRRRSAFSTDTGTLAPPSSTNVQSTMAWVR